MGSDAPKRRERGSDDIHGFDLFKAWTVSVIPLEVPETNSWFVSLTSLYECSGLTAIRTDRGIIMTPPVWASGMALFYILPRTGTRADGTWNGVAHYLIGALSGGVLGAGRLQASILSSRPLYMDAAILCSAQISHCDMNTRPPRILLTGFGHRPNNGLGFDTVGMVDWMIRGELNVRRVLLGGRSDPG